MRKALVVVAAVLSLLLAKPARAGDPYLRWYTLVTPHFRVHFHGGLEHAAQKVANVPQRLKPLEESSNEIVSATARLTRAAVALEPENPMARWVLGKSLVAQGQCTAAKTELEKFSAIPTIKPEAREGAKQLLGSCTPAKKK